MRFTKDYGELAQSPVTCKKLKHTALSDAKKSKRFLLRIYFS